MKIIQFFLLALGLAGMLGASGANAQHRHHSHSRASVGVVFGAPWPYYGPPYPYYYPYYPYPYPPVVTVPSSPPVYIERSQDEVESENYWYYCSNPKGYYPYIRECKTNWQRVTPVPQGN